MVIRRAVLAIVAALAVILILATIGAILVAQTHRTGGCNNVPLVNGQPAYRCTG